jgi:PAS domain S-box-containing protein
VTTYFDAQIDYLRAALAGRTGPDLLHSLSGVLQTLGVAALAADTKGRYVAANAAAQQLTGYSGDELMRMSVTDLTPRTAAPDGEVLWEEFIASGVQHGTYEVRRKQGQPTAVRYWAFANVAPGIHLSLLKLEAPAA